MKANKDPNENTTGNYASYASPTTNDNTLDLGGFVKIGGDLNEDSDPRRMRGGFLGTAGLRRRHLKLIDGQGWHYGVMAVMILDFFLEFLGISFSSERQFSSFFDRASLYMSTVALVLYIVDMSIRITGLRSALLRSNSTVADLCMTILLAGLVITRFLYDS